MITPRFTFGERKIYSTIRKSQNILNMIVCKTFLSAPWLTHFTFPDFREIILLLPDSGAHFCFQGGCLAIDRRGAGSAENRGCFRTTTLGK